MFPMNLPDLVVKYAEPVREGQLIGFEKYSVPFACQS